MLEINLEMFGGRGGNVAKNGFIDKSRYKADHEEVVKFVKKQVGLDLNKYRDGDGSSPDTTTYWEKKGSAVVINHKALSMVDKQKLDSLQIKEYGIDVTEGGGWFSYVSMKKWRLG